MSILIKLYVLSDFSSDFIALKTHLSEKKSFEPIIFQLPNIKTSQGIAEVYNYQQT